MLEINDSVFRKMKYEYRWIKEEIFHIFNKDQSIKICAKAFNEKPITDFQRESYKKLKQNFYSIIETCCNLISDYSVQFYSVKLEDKAKINEAVKLTHIIFMQDGDTIFLFDTKYDVENGIGIQIYPEFEIGPQDTFL